ncbi:hypothetical protein VOLCADRAFT_104985 [Volvox carteri f. nagariensis]|uniref:Pherophorin domain-containing protein n=1 Tax=Volvox carteri f. nagariensis TaxID=3068 RepID=D8TXM5_VOLCA|nr:uncharacterized protein VOLCADRAFT_104985 [Volvox carteri f. nagariensis]EFJ47666.1 hypothetical protein VOLCADRAFT_104985 [Volvox carteri f. nagariensis]|eukprot:XP_002951137.1 hypothetical protein VOLCADRAFT_104985 [Volvox carteri f. nagariensis]
MFLLHRSFFMSYWQPPPSPPKPPSPPPPPPTFSFSVTVEFTSIFPWLGKPDRQFGRDVNCTELADLISTDLTTAATQAQTSFLIPLQVNTCNNSRFVMSGAIARDWSACLELDTLINDRMLPYPSNFITNNPEYLHSFNVAVSVCGLVLSYVPPGGICKGSMSRAVTN